MSNPVKNQTFSPLGRFLATILVATGVLGGGGLAIREFTSVGSPSQTAYTVGLEPLNVFVTATGSTTLKYDATCVANPLVSLGLGTGAIIRLSYQVGSNPAGVEADVGFVKSCDDQSGSGQDLLNNTCSSTGCVSQYTTGTALWNGADYIKVTLKDDPTSDYTARLRILYEDVFGE